MAQSRALQPSYMVNALTACCSVPHLPHLSNDCNAACDAAEGVAHNTLSFTTKKRDLTVQQLPTAANSLPVVLITLPRSNSSTQLPEGLSFDRDKLQVVTEDIPVKEVLYAESTRNAIVVLQDSAGRQELESLQPDLQLMMAKLQTNALNGVIVTCQGDQSPYHFLSRYFAPWIGCGEDAVTGSAHTATGPYWAQRLNMRGKPLQARQCSRRGGDVTVTVSEDGDTVSIAGQAVVISSEKVSLPF